MITVNDKGRTYLMGLLTGRNLMYQEVYWHKTVRACTTMFKRFFFELFSRGLLSKETVDPLFDHPDDVFLQKLAVLIVKDHQDLQPLVQPLINKGRSLYKSVYIFTHGDKNESSKSVRFFDPVLEGNFAKCVEISRKLASVLKTKRNDLSDRDILVDATPSKKGKEYYDLKRLQVWNLRKKRYEDLSSGMIELDKFLRENQRAFIFYHPKFYDWFAGFSAGDWDDIFLAVDKEVASSKS